MGAGVEDKGLNVKKKNFKKKMAHLKRNGKKEEKNDRLEITSSPRKIPPS